MEAPTTKLYNMELKMSSLNKVFILGRLGQDTKSIQFNGNKMVTFSVATQANFNGNKSVEWHSITSYGNIAESCEKHLKKGSTVLVEGRIKYKSYTDKNGVVKNSTSIQANSVKFLGPKLTHEDTECYNSITTTDGVSDDIKTTCDTDEEFYIPF